MGSTPGKNRASGGRVGLTDRLPFSWLRTRFSLSIQDWKRDASIETSDAVRRERTHSIILIVQECQAKIVAFFKMHQFTHAVIQHLTCVVLLPSETSVVSRFVVRSATYPQINVFFGVVEHDDACFGFDVSAHAWVSFVGRSCSTLALLAVLFFLLANFLLVFLSLTLEPLFIGFLKKKSP
jgi:hypothetical protein